MLLHLLVFLYMFATSYVIGRFVSSVLLKHLFGTVPQIHPVLYSASGLGYIMVAAGFFSLFAPIGLAFNIALCLATVFIFIRERNRSLSPFGQYHTGLPWNAILLFLLISLIFVLVKSSGPVTNPDTGGYHMPFVKWTEQYPVIKGLANVQSRFGFNYQYLVLAAVYGFSFLGIPTVHATNGYIMVMLLWYIATSLDFVKTRQLSWLDTVKVVVLFFVINMSNAMSSISPDFPSSAFSIIVVLLVLGKAQHRNFFAFDHTALFIFILSIFAVLFKLSVLPVLLFNLLFLLSVFSKSRYAAACITLGIIFFIPYLLRNYLISGYLVYPLYAIDIFDVQWKIPLATAIYEKQIVKYYALNLPIGTHLSLPDTIKAWFGYLRISNPIYVYIVYLLCLCVALNFVLLAYVAIKKSWDKHAPLIFINAFLFLSLIYWFNLGPDPRFGNGYIIPFIAITVAVFVYGIAKKLQHIFVYGALLVFAVFQVAMLKGSALSKSYYNQDNKISFNLVLQAPYPVPDTFTFALPGGQKILKTVNNTQCWDAPLPCAFERDNFEMKGQKPEDGFVPVMVRQ